MAQKPALTSATLVEPAVLRTSPALVTPAVYAPAQPETKPILRVADGEASRPATVPDARPAANSPAPLELETIRSAMQSAVPKIAPVDQREAEALLVLGRKLIAQGDISGARLALERAVTAGHPQATLLMAQTYDPQILARWHSVGVKPDVGLARNLYAQAAERGVPEARDRLSELR